MTGLQAPVAVLLEFERAHPGGSGRKEQAVRLEFGLTLPRWYQQLDRVLRTREALEHDAVFVHHLRDLADRRARRRAGLITRRTPCP